MQDCLCHSVSNHLYTKYLILLNTDMRRFVPQSLAWSAIRFHLRSVLSPTINSVAVWLSLSAGWCISRSAIKGDTLQGHTAILGQGMYGGTGGRLRQKVGVFREFVLKLINIFLMAGRDREGQGGEELWRVSQR